MTNIKNTGDTHEVIEKVSETPTANANTVDTHH